MRLSNMLLLTLFISALVSAEDTESQIQSSYPAQVYWGDTHVHSYLSGDAFALGNRLSPDAAYRFAKGETVQATSGQELQLRRPLDFLMVSDHAENLGVLSNLLADNGSVPDHAVSRQWKKVLKALPRLAEIFNSDSEQQYQQDIGTVLAAKKAHAEDYDIDAVFQKTVWKDVIAVAEAHYNPGTFTTFVGYEWSSASKGGGGIHRNVLFADGPEKTKKTLPFSANDSKNVEDLWDYLERYERDMDGNVMAIPHNGNLSKGRMFALKTYDDKPLNKNYARQRMRWEPLYEVTQIKGDGETHPLLSDEDEFADFETWPPKVWGMKSGGEASSYARSALMLGLEQQTEIGTNPFKFGMIGSTDSHTALATGDESQFWGKMSIMEPNRYRAKNDWFYSSSGYAAVWAEDNTREALFAAMQRKETYATTGPRLLVRFFGGWNFTSKDLSNTNFPETAYKKGVPMGGDLSFISKDKVPHFLVSALKDPAGANLDRIQIIKGWRDREGELHEKIYNVALSDQRKVTPDGSAPAVGNSVDLKTTSYENSIGEIQLSAIWKDPDFDPDCPAFYYTRILEIPTPRWTAYDAKTFNLDNLPEEIPMIVQERAYSSPIWYTP